MAVENPKLEKKKKQDAAIVPEPKLIKTKSSVLGQLDLQALLTTIIVGLLAFVMAVRFRFSTNDDMLTLTYLFIAMRVSLLMIFGAPEATGMVATALGVMGGSAGKTLTTGFHYVSAFRAFPDDIFLFVTVFGICMGLFDAGLVLPEALIAPLLVPLV